MRLIRPITEAKLKELEKELENQKQRFWNATTRSASKIQNDVSIDTWIRHYPIQTATICFFAAFYIAQKMSSPSISPPQKD